MHASQSLDEFFLLDGQTLESVWQQYEDNCLDLLVLDFGVRSLVIAANAEDDTITFRTSNSENIDRKRCTDISQIDPWVGLIGKEFGWGWININQQENCDGVLLGFDGIYPQVSLNVVASSILVAKVIPCPMPTA